MADGPESDSEKMEQGVGPAIRMFAGLEGASPSMPDELLFTRSSRRRRGTRS